METLNQKEKTLRSDCYAIYILLACGTVLAILGLFLAYAKKQDAVGTPYESHLDWQIKTFWLSLPYFIMALAPIVFWIFGAITFQSWWLVGSSVIWVCLMIWWMARILYGLSGLRNNLPIPY